MASQKGGVGKTTTSAALAAAYQEQGKRVLAVDLDPQGGLTIAFGFAPEAMQRTPTGKWRQQQHTYEKTPIH